MAFYLACVSNVSARVRRESGVESSLFCFLTLFDLPFLLLLLQRWRHNSTGNVCSIGYMLSCLMWTENDHFLFSHKVQPVKCFVSFLLVTRASGLMAAHDSTEAPQLCSQPRSQGPLLLVPRRRREWVGRVGEDPGNEVGSSGFP